MNPSASDWITKFVSHYQEEQLIDNFPEQLHFYDELRASGFIYGVSLQSVLDEKISPLALTKDEYTKVNLFHALLHGYYQHQANATIDEAIKNIIEFYRALDKGKTGFLKKLSFLQKPTHILEQILASRLQETNNFAKKRMTSVFTYALLYVDVVAFRHWLEHPNAVKLYANEIESTVIRCCFLALKSKAKKSKYDTLLIELFENSSDYLLDDFQASNDLSLDKLHYLHMRTPLEKRFILDICAIAVWEDKKLDIPEKQFLSKLNTVLELSEAHLQKSINHLSSFSEVHTKKISLFEYTTPVKHFYKQSSAMVKLLILRNRDRLLKELDESGELLLLLGQSAIRELTSEEKKRVKRQLLDVCKSIPSLAIFLLPGGAILLPIMVKLIPKLLPTAFDENRLEK